MLGALVSQLSEALAAERSTAPLLQPAGVDLPDQPAAAGAGADAAVSTAGAGGDVAAAGETAASEAPGGAAGAVAVGQPAAGAEADAADPGATGAASSAAAEAALQGADGLQREATELGDPGEAAQPEDAASQPLSQHEAAQLRSGLAKVRTVQGFES